ncbi:hypothetical protein PTKIN_Ptkin10aG0129000 [Pterospermum kingtungense]
MKILSFSTLFLLFTIFFHSCLCQKVPSDDALVNREALEIIIGGGPAPSPEYEEPPPPEPECPPPPPPECPPPPSPPPPSPPPPPPPSPPPPSPPPPSPPPPPPCYGGGKYGCFENERLAKSFRVIQNFRMKLFDDDNSRKYTRTWKGNDVCKYKGFFCDNYPEKFRSGGNQKSIAAVDFNGAKFHGKKGLLPLNDFIEQLDQLAIFHANSNNFSGTVPTNVSRIKYLYELDLSNNKLSGNFPKEVLSAKNLTFLDIRFNKINGVVPQQVFDLDLDVLFINNNNLEQKLPENLGDTPVLYLTFANNKFTGHIPRSIGRAPNLLEVLFLNNSLTGCLPYEIGNLSQATVFDVGTNKLTGPIPYSFGCLKKIELLNLANNQFYGEVPEIVCKLPKIENFSLSNNYFTQVGPACRDLIMKKKLDVRNNCILDLPSQKSKAECAAFFSRKLQCERKESFKWIPCMKGGYNLYNSTEESAQESTVSVPSTRTYSTLNPHRL